jgi:hypothetical protein
MGLMEDNHLELALALQEASGAAHMFPEDRALWRYLRARKLPGRIEPVSVRLDFLTGYTSNSMAGSPTDPGASGPGSALARLNLMGRLVWPRGDWLRPALDLDFRSHGVTAQAASNLSYLEISPRPHVILGSVAPRLLLGYRFEVLLLNQDEARRFFTAHRGEVEIEARSLTAFAGVGHRTFHEDERTRMEFDGGVGAPLRLFPGLQILVAGSLRYHLAESDQYDLVGATGLLVGRIDLGGGFLGRLGISVLVDDYFDSGGEQGLLTFGTEEERIDILVKASAGFWSPITEGIRLGLVYEFSWRDSSADEVLADYDYREHRILLGLRGAFEFDPWAPNVTREPGHVGLDYGLEEGTGASLDEERIQDLLRQDEAYRQGTCGCN